MKNNLAQGNSKKFAIFCGVALMLLFGTLQAFASCPSVNAIGNYKVSNIAAVHTSAVGSTVAYFLDTTAAPTAGAGLVEYCVYPSSSSDSSSFAFDAPSSFVADFPNWLTNPNKFTNGSTNFSFVRDTGTDLIPFNRASVGVGNATFLIVPATTTIVLHISDPDECNAVYGTTGAITCFVIPGGTPPPPTHWPLEGRKFYDLNGDGVRQDGEPFITGWKIHAIGDNPMTVPSVLEPNWPDAHGNINYFSAIVSTSNSANDDNNNLLPPGSYVLAKLTTGGTYGTCEIYPSGRWVATTVRQAHSLGGADWESEIFCPRHIQADESANNTFNSYACYSTDNTFDGINQNQLSLDLSGSGSGPYVNLVPGRGPVDFGNVCTGAGGGLTLGFWSNTNGEATMSGLTTKVSKSCGSDPPNATSTATLAILSGLNLVTSTGAPFDPTSYCQFRTWILGATSTNMAYMLSAQLAAMELNVNFQKVQGAALVYAGPAPTGCSVNGLSGTGFITINNLMADANASLGSNPVTLSGNPVRSCQEFMKTTLDSANNNLNFLQNNPQACGLTSNGDETFDASGRYVGTEDCKPAQMLNVVNGVAAGIAPIPQ